MKLTPDHVSYASCHSENNVRRLANFLVLNGWEIVRATGTLDQVIKSLHDAGFFDNAKIKWKPKIEYFRGRVE